MLLELNQGILDKLTAALSEWTFPTVPLIVQNLQDPIIRPSIRVSLEKSMTNRLNAGLLGKEVLYKIYFYAGNAEQSILENLTMCALLENTMLGLVEAGDNKLSIEKTETEIVDGILQCSLQLAYEMPLPQRDGPDIENLHYNANNFEA